MRSRSVKHFVTMTARDELLDRTMTALADRTRRKLIERLASKPQRAGDLWRGIPMSRPAVSKHLRVLREARLIQSSRRGREMVYRLSPNHRGLDELGRYVQQVSAFWDITLDAFKTFAEKE